MEDIITVGQAQEILGISHSGVVKAINRGAIKAQKFGRNAWLVSHFSVLAYKESRRGYGGRPKRKK